MFAYMVFSLTISMSDIKKLIIYLQILIISKKKKKMKKLLTLLLLATLFASCSSDDDDDNHNSNALIGTTWADLEYDIETSGDTAYVIKSYIKFNEKTIDTWGYEIDYKNNQPYDTLSYSYIGIDTYTYIEPNLTLNITEDNGSTSVYKTVISNNKFKVVYDIDEWGEDSKTYTKQ